ASTLPLGGPGNSRAQSSTNSEPLCMTRNRFAYTPSATASGNSMLMDCGFCASNSPFAPLAPLGETMLFSGRRENRKDNRLHETLTLFRGTGGAQTRDNGGGYAACGSGRREGLRVCGPPPCVRTPPGTRTSSRDVLE